MATVADYSWARPDPQALVNAGYSGVIRYLSYESRDHIALAGQKDLTPPELQRLHDAGLAVGIAFETTANAALGGYQTGIEHAQVANRAADRLGWPRDKAIVYAVDFNPNASQLLAVADYFWGVASVPGRPVGAYGCCDVIEYLAARIGAIVVFWQCAAWSGAGQGSGGSMQSGYRDPVRLCRHTDLFQHYGLTGPFGDAIDRNDLLTADAGRLLWHPNESAPAPPELEDLTMKAVHLPDEPAGEPQFWQPIDGLRRVAYELPATGDPAVDLAELAMSMGIGAVDPDVVTLTGDQAELFKRRYYPVKTAHDVHWGGVALMLDMVDRITKAIPGVDPETVKTAVAAALEHVSVPTTISSTDRDAIVSQVTAGLVAAMGHATTAAAGALTG